MNAKRLLVHWEEVRQGLFQALDKIHDNQLHFVPRDGLRSLSEVALHIADTENGWFGYVIKREYHKWPHDYTLEKYPAVTSIRSLLTEVHVKTEAYLESLQEADLERTVETPWGSRLSMNWIIWHVVEHEIHHRGEIFLMLGLLGIEAPDI